MALRLGVWAGLLVGCRASDRPKEAAVVRESGGVLPVNCSDSPPQDREVGPCGAPFFREAGGLGDGSVERYSRFLRAMGEPSIAAGAGVEAYRFLLLGRSVRPIVVRIQRQDGRVQAITKTLAGDGAGQPGSLLKKDVTSLDPAAWSRLERSVEKAQFWALDPHRRGGEDGEHWVLEGYDGKRHHVVDRWSPTLDPMRDTCALMMDLARTTQERVH